jgi:hypothetical protein
MRTTNDKLARAALPAAIAILCVLGTVTTVSAITELTHPTAHLGDIVAFTASKVETATEDAHLIVHRQNRFGCVLDLNVLRRSGGSLMVESQFGPGHSFRVHWAGARTTNDTADCGRQADLIVASGDLDILALAAGGYGADRKQTPFIAAYFGN